MRVGRCVVLGTVSPCHHALTHIALCETATTAANKKTTTSDNQTPVLGTVVNCFCLFFFVRLCVCFLTLCTDPFLLAVARECCLCFADHPVSHHLSELCACVCVFMGKALINARAAKHRERETNEAGYGMGI